MTISDKRSLDSRRALPSYPLNTQAPVPRNSRERREEKLQPVRTLRVVYPQLNKLSLALLFPNTPSALLH